MVVLLPSTDAAVHPSFSKLRLRPHRGQALDAATMMPEGT